MRARSRCLHRLLIVWLGLTYQTDRNARSTCEPSLPLRAPQLIEDRGNISEAQSVWLYGGHFSPDVAWSGGEMDRRAFIKLAGLGGGIVFASSLGLNTLGSVLDYAELSELEFS